MFKRFWTLILSVVLACAALPGHGLAAESQPLTVAAPTPCSGYFYSDMWSNNSVDIDIRSMLHGYATVALNMDGQYELDGSVVASMDTSDTALGRTYTLTLVPGATYNNGQAITAADYVFTVLLQSDPAIAALGGNNALFSYLLGYEDYASGLKSSLRGVQLLSDTQFALTVSAEALPYYYEASYLNVSPTPISELAPGYAVRDDGEGAYLANESGAPAALTTTLLRETLLSDTGYMHQPKVTCGPYELTEYDAATGTVLLTANTAYRGSRDGQKPSISSVKVISLSDDEALAAFKRGEVQIINKLSTSGSIDQATALESAGKAGLIRYARNGLAFLAFACESAPLDDADVRKALSMCVNRELLCSKVLSGCASPVYGYYGIGQWMADETDLSKYKEYDYNVNGARKLLARAGYTLNASGEEYKAQYDDVRYKKTADGALAALELRWAKTPGEVSDQLLEQLSPVLATLGVRLTVTDVSFTDMLKDYYRENGVARRYNLYFLGTNFRETFDPYYTYNTADAWQGAFNTSGLRSDALMQAAGVLRRVSAGDTRTYLTRWLDFQDAWHEEMPLAPLYSNLYCDVCTPDVSNYVPSSYIGFGQALLYASVTQP